ncbi:unnamed protein product [Adineta steineri]|uniref:G-protein coupled receptors family 1 profile domain-containing protein n=1 Tax=Adineta steineri TaxID=433720 RepID=A0A814QS08_9BILA|nr:unnamed protein product [Adineta steineri]CAF1123656.1 unnamed protein product [Adineta steineri]
MSMPSSNSIDIKLALAPDGVAIPYIARFWMFLVSDILSLMCCVFVLYYFLFDSTLRRGLYNHVFIVVLFLCIIWELTIIPWIMHIYFYNVVWIQSQTFCIIWKFIQSLIYTTIPKLVGWASVERNILIYHYQLVSTKKKRIIIHYIPIILILIYGIVLYAIITPINDCKRIFSYNTITCAYVSCTYNSATYALYEFFSGGILSSCCIGFGSASLIIRNMYQKHRLQRQIHWRKHRKMTIQLLSVASIFYVLFLPRVVFGITEELHVQPSFDAVYNRYASFFAYYIVFLLPFACAGTLPQLRKRLLKVFGCSWRQRQMRVVAVR